MRLLQVLCIPCLLAAQTPRELLDKAVADFEALRISESVAGFDKLVSVAPQAMPQLWQRGIAQYYAGRYADCRKQFEAHRNVNPNDVENAAWHYLCVARAESPAKARAALLPVGPDSRAPMKEIYRMYRGELTPQQVLDAAGSGLEAQFYAHLYVALFHEAQGDRDQAKKHITIAAEDRFAAGGYMHMVARVHRDLGRY